MITGPEYVQIIIALIAVLIVTNKWGTGFESIILSAFSTFVLGLILLDHLWIVAATVTLIVAILGYVAFKTKHLSKKMGGLRHERNRKI